MAVQLPAGSGLPAAVLLGLDPRENERTDADWREMAAVLVDALAEAELYKVGWQALVALPGLASLPKIRPLLAGLPARLRHESRILMTQQPSDAPADQQIPGQRKQLTPTTVAPATRESSPSAKCVVAAQMTTKSSHLPGNRHEALGGTFVQPASSHLGETELAQSPAIINTIVAKPPVRIPEARQPDAEMTAAEPRTCVSSRPVSAAKDELRETNGTDRHSGAVCTMLSPMVATDATSVAEGGASGSMQRGACHSAGAVAGSGSASDGGKGRADGGCGGHAVVGAANGPKDSGGRRSGRQQDRGQRGQARKGQGRGKGKEQGAGHGAGRDERTTSGRGGGQRATTRQLAEAGAPPTPWLRSNAADSGRHRGLWRRGGEPPSQSRTRSPPGCYPHKWGLACWPRPPRALVSCCEHGELGTVAM